MPVGPDLRMIGYMRLVLILALLWGAFAFAEIDADRMPRVKFKQAGNLEKEGEFKKAEAAYLDVKSKYGDIVAPGESGETLGQRADVRLMNVRCRMKRGNEFHARKWEDLHKQLMEKLRAKPSAADVAALMSCEFVVGREGGAADRSISPLGGFAGAMASVVSKYEWGLPQNGTAIESEDHLLNNQPVALPDLADADKRGYFTFIYRKDVWWTWGGLLVDGQNETLLSVKP